MPPILILLFSCTLAAAAAGVFANERSVKIVAERFAREISLVEGNVSTTNLAIAGHNLLSGSACDFSCRISFAQPNRRPPGMQPDGTPPIDSTKHFGPGVDSFRAPAGSDQTNTGVKWENAIQVRADSWARQFGKLQVSVIKPAPGCQRVIIATSKVRTPDLKGLKIKLVYEVYEGFPVIRKWVEISNGGQRWLKGDNFTIDDLELGSDYRNQTSLTPGERGAGSSIVAFGTADGARGVIAVSEIPSALRHTAASGAMGYAQDYFEWVLGPGESFVSEPVYWLAYDGELQKTVSGVSTPRDRAVEGSHMQFLRQHVGIAADQGKIDAPQWCSWANFRSGLSDANMREQGAIAARCGFALMLLDQGWQQGLVGTEPDPAKFPNFAGTCDYLKGQGIKIGLWVACYRSEGSPDLRTMAEARSLPLVTRDGGYAMSFASPWRRFYANDLAGVSRRYGVSYFKQDFTNLKFGDIAEGHESRTRKESLLRGLRGLLESQDLLRKAAPEVTAQLTHEIYWGTPGVPCDVAALKHAARYHIPPNNCVGGGNNSERPNANWSFDPAKLQQQQTAGCFAARRRLFAHRGLPLYGLEYYAAATVNFRGSLTPDLQDRQICSWLMGAPVTFAGDLASLTKENIALYRQRFDSLGRLERDYDIYRYFQFSGVPEPTDTDWHWWGKLNQDGAGAVVVLRGGGGAEERAVNIPWVLPGRAYEVQTLLRGQPLGQFSGKALQEGALRVRLPVFGQEILEIKLR